MTDYEFVESFIENAKDGEPCRVVDGVFCLTCPIRGGGCSDENIVKKAKAWLESHKKENPMDGIKVTVEEKKAEEKAKYPCVKIGKDSGTIVLFYSEDCGIVIKEGENYNSNGGYHHTNWDEKYGFKPFHGTIKIEVE